MNKKLFWRIGMLISGFCVAVLVYANWIILSYNKNIFSSVADAPTYTVALVFGGGMKNETAMSEMQEDRVIRSVELYKAGKAKKLLMTGDGGGMRADEVGAMKAYAVAHGVPEADVLTDPHGYNTYASCARARTTYFMSSTIAISQSFHLPRIRYFCEHKHIHTAGLSADIRRYHSWWGGGLREILARVKAWGKVRMYDFNNP